MLKDAPEMLTLKTFIELFGNNISAQVVRRRCKAGEIPSIKMNGKWFIPRDLVFGEIIEKEELLCTEKAPEGA